MISSEFFLATCSSLWIGVKLTIFFKRSFRWREHCFPRLSLDSANLILIIAAQFLVPKVWLLQMITAVIAMVSAITDMYLMMSNLWELVKSLVLGAYIIVSWESERGSHILPLSSVSFALTQFLRWPRWLKDYLREVRIVCGPAISPFCLRNMVKTEWTFWLVILGSSRCCTLFLGSRHLFSPRQLWSFGLVSSASPQLQKQESLSCNIDGFQSPFFDSAFIIILNFSFHLL